MYTPTLQHMNTKRPTPPLPSGFQIQLYQLHLHSFYLQQAHITEYSTDPLLSMQLVFHVIYTYGSRDTSKDI